MTSHICLVEAARPLLLAVEQRENHQFLVLHGVAEEIRCALDEVIGEVIGDTHKTMIGMIGMIGNDWGE